MDANLTIDLFFSKDLEFKCKFEKLVELEGDKVPQGLRKKVEIEAINNRIFQLIQDIQKSGKDVDKNKVFEQLQSIQEQMEPQFMETMKLRSDKKLKKELLGQL